VNILALRPAGRAAGRFEELPISRQARLQRIAMARREVVTSLTVLVGDPDAARAVLAGIDELDRVRTEFGRISPEAMAKQGEVERMLVSSGGRAGLIITSAERDRWVELMNRRGQANRTRSQIEAYRAAPELYQQREIMRVYARALAPIRKYLIGIDPDRVQMDIDVKELAPLFEFTRGGAEQGTER
jgi:hypothetical protein